MNVVAIIEQMCHVLRMISVKLVLFRPTDKGAFICLTLLLPNLIANIVFVHAALLWCGTLCIVSTLAVIEQMCHILRMLFVQLVLFRPTDRGAFIFFPYCLMLPNLNANLVFVCAALCGVAHYIL